MTWWHDMASHDIIWHDLRHDLMTWHEDIWWHMAWWYMINIIRYEMILPYMISIFVTSWLNIRHILTDRKIIRLLNFLPKHSSKCGTAVYVFWAFQYPDPFVCNLIWYCLIYRPPLSMHPARIWASGACCNYSAWARSGWDQRLHLRADATELTLM